MSTLKLKLYLETTHQEVLLNYDIKNEQTVLKEDWGTQGAKLDERSIHLTFMWSEKKFPIKYIHLPFM